MLMTETEMTPSNTPIALPAGHHQVLYWSLTADPKRAIAMQLLSIPLFIVFFGIFFGLAATLGRAPNVNVFGVLNIVVILLAVVITLVLHELVHGLVMQAFGAHPQYGVLPKQLMFYATSPNYAFRRNAYLTVALAPLVGISLLAILGIALLAGTSWTGLLALCAAVNGGGAIGDLWISAVVLRHPPQAYVVDERDGMRLFLPDKIL